jgi:hypothetical protein
LTFPLAGVVAPWLALGVAASWKEVKTWMESVDCWHSF